MEIMDIVSYLPCDPSNCGGKRKKEDIRYLVYHYTGNDGDTAENNARYYSNPINPPASAHYFVDDNGIFQSVGELTIAWAVGGERWDDCSETGGGKLYGIATNANSISIEICDNPPKDGKIRPTEATLQNAVELGKNVMQRYNIPIERVIRHFDVTGKHCPAYFMDDAAWAAFRARFAEEDHMERYDNMAEIKASLPWAVPTIDKLIRAGALTGTSGWYDGDGYPTGLDLSEDMIRTFVICDRAGAFA